MSAGSSIMARQLKRSVPSGAQLAHRWRWSRIRTRGFAPRPSRGHQRSTPAGSLSAARARYHPTTAWWDSFGAVALVEPLGRGDSEAPVIKADSGRRTSARSTIKRTLRPRYGSVSPLTKRLGAASNDVPDA